MRSEADKAARKGRIGSTDISAILGMHPSRRPIDVFRAVAEGCEPEPSEQMMLGDHLEPFILDAYRRKTGRKVEACGPLLHPKLPTVATPDSIATTEDGEEIALEAKSVIGWQAQEYGDGEDEVPEHHIVQGTWHLAHLRAQGRAVERCHFPVLIGGCCPIRIYEVRWDETLATNLLRKAADWHAQHIATGIPPEVDGSPAYTQFLAERWQGKEPLRAATAEEVEMVCALRSRAVTLAGVKEQVEFARNELRATIGDAAGIEGQGFRVTWKRNKKGTRTLLVKFNGDTEEAENGNG